MLKKIVAIFLATAVTGLAPGLDFYQALGQGMPARKASGTPMASALPVRISGPEMSVGGMVVPALTVAGPGIVSPLIPAALEAPTLAVPPNAEAEAALPPGLVEQVEESQRLQGALHEQNPQQEQKLEEIFDRSPNHSATVAPEITASEKGGPELYKAISVWTQLSGFLREKIGFPSGEDVKIRRWRAASIELMRSHPALPVEQVLEETLATIHHLRPAQTDMARKILGEKQAENYPQAWRKGIGQFARKRDGEILNFTKTGNVLDSLYLAAAQGLFKYERGATNRSRWEWEFVDITGYSGPVHDVMQYRGRPCAATQNGLWLQNLDGSWSKEFSSDYFFHVAVQSDRLYVAQDGELWQHAPGLSAHRPWRNTPLPGGKGKILKLASGDPGLRVVVQDGVIESEYYLLDSGRWLPIKKTAVAWRDVILKDIGDAIDAKNTDAAVSNTRIDQELEAADGRFIRQDGRSIFSALISPAQAVFTAAAVAARVLANTPAEAPKKAPEDISRLPIDQQLDALIKKYKVPAAEAPLRRKLALQAWGRIKLDLPLFLNEPEAKVGLGSWWMTNVAPQKGEAREIFVPFEDIFVRAVDPAGVEEAVGAAIHETLHYLITRIDEASPLTDKYAKNTSPPANNLLMQVIEDSRINTWGLIQHPGYKPYLDAIYESLWPENPDQVDLQKQKRISLLDHSAVKVLMPDKKETDFVPPHVQYANSILYYWRHRKAPPFLKDPMAIDAFDKTKAALDRIRNIHPQAMGGVLLEHSKTAAWREAFEAVDREIYPYYEKLIQKSKDELKKMMDAGGKLQKQDGSGAGNPSPQEILDELDKDIAKEIHKHADPHDEHSHEHKAASAKPSEEDGASGKATDESWAERRDKALSEQQKIDSSWTDYERYKLRAQELGLISKVDGIIKKLLLPTKHSRLSRLLYEDGDEPDMNKFYDDAAQGRMDTPIMRRWSRKVRRSAKISLVLDVSGSMQDMTPDMSSPLDYALLGIVGWMEVCQKNNLDFEVVLFGSKTEVAHPFGKTINKASKDALIKAVGQFKYRGGTAIGEAVKTALDDLGKQAATDRFIIVATDEGQNSGDGPEKWMGDAKKNKIVTIAMVIGGEEAGFQKHFDYAVRVKEAKDFPRDLLEVLKKAMRAILGPLSASFAFMAAVGLPFILELSRHLDVGG